MAVRKLDIGCGERKNEGFDGMDLRELPGVDIVWDVEKFPWPIEDETYHLVVCAHLIEHLKPWLSLNFMNEVWRICHEGATFAIAMPYPGSDGYYQDPTHCNGWNQYAFEYFDPSKELYDVYKPKPWKIDKVLWNSIGNLEATLYKMAEEV